MAWYPGDKRTSTSFTHLPTYSLTYQHTWGTTFERAAALTRNSRERTMLLARAESCR